MADVNEEGVEQTKLVGQEPEDAEHVEPLATLSEPGDSVTVTQTYPLDDATAPVDGPEQPSEPVDPPDSQPEQSDPQPAFTDPPSHPLPSDSKGPLDALADTDQDLTPLSGPHLPATGADTPVAGPEDALDPTVENALDYGERIEDAAHFTHEPVPDDEQTVDGPRSRPVAQNQAASGQLERAGDDQAIIEDGS